MLLLQADVLELKANPKADASGLIIESRLDIGRGPVATMLVQRGTMHPGEAVVAGDAWGKVRAMYDDTGARLKDAGPAVPVEILGFDHPPVAGERARVVDSERTARQQAQQRAQRLRAESLARRQKTISLEHLFDAVKAGGIRELNLIIKADVQGSVEAALGEVQKIKSDEVAVRVIHTGVGAIVESDINLAAASTAIVVGFNVRPNAEAKALADREGVDVRTYRVIYQLTEDIEKALVGLLAPDTVEDVLGEAEVRALFRSSRLGVIAGCMVTTGKLERSARVRVVREGALVWDGNIGSLRRVQEDVREVAAGLRVRHPARGLQRPQGGRRPRVLRHAPGRAQLARQRRGQLARASGDLDDGRAVGAVGDRLVDQRMLRELVSHGLAQRTGSAAVDDPHLGTPGHVRGVDVGARRLARLVGAPAAHVELVGDVRWRARAHVHVGLGRDRGATLRVGGELRERDVHAEVPAVHLGLVAGDLDDHAAHARGWGRPPDRRRRAALSVAPSRATRARDAARAARSVAAPSRRSRSRSAVADPGVDGARLRRSRSARARGADVGTQRLELATLVGELALGLGECSLARRLRRGADALDLVLQLDRPWRRRPRRRQPRRASAAPRRRAQRAARRSLSAAAVSSSSRRRRSGATARSGRLDDRRVEPEALPPSAARAMRPGRPTVSVNVGASVAASNPTEAFSAPSCWAAHSLSSG